MEQRGGTVLVRNINPNGSSNPDRFFSSIMEFVISWPMYNVHGTELWRFRWN
jgi:hypothetical protein